MGILIRQENQGEDWIVEFREVWNYTSKENFEKARSFFDAHAIPYCVIFGFEIFIIELKNTKFATSFEQLNELMPEILELKKIGVSPEKIDFNNLVDFNEKK